MFPRNNDGATAKGFASQALAEFFKSFLKLLLVSNEPNNLHRGRRGLLLMSGMEKSI